MRSDEAITGARGGKRWGRLARSCMGAALGVALDAAIGEPPARMHPVVGIGNTLSRLERVFWQDSRVNGAAFATGALLVSGSISKRLGKGVVPTSLSVFLTSAGKELYSVALLVHNRLEVGDLEGARREVRALVGRDVAHLDEKDLARAVIESVAENTADAILGPLLYGGVFGPPGAWIYRVTNTMDSMFGYKSALYVRFGWACARIDDGMNLAVARWCVLLVMLVTKSQNWGEIISSLRGASDHPSPNAGLVEASFAASLGIRLGGVSAYRGEVEVRPSLGNGREATFRDIPRAVDLSKRVVSLATSVIFATGFIAWLASLERERKWR